MYESLDSRRSFN